MSSRIRRIALFALAVLNAAWFLLPVAAFAANCCNCYPKTNSTKTVCLTASQSDCSTLIANTSNPNIKSYACDLTTLDDPKCKPIASGGSGLCQEGPVDAIGYKPSTAPASQFQPVVPQLNVPIPGVAFSPDLDVVEGNIQIPFIGEYTAGVYKYLLGITVIAAAVMVVYGGFRYLVGSTLSSVDRGKEIIRNAIMGLLLTFGAFTILQTINPATTTLGKLNVRFITPVSENLEAVSTPNFWQAVKSTGADVPASLTGGGSSIADQPVKPGTKIMDHGCELEINQAKIPTVKSLYACAVTLANDVGVPPCYVIVALNRESYFALSLAGHDENVTAKVNKDKNNQPALIKARIDFLASGKTFKGQPITNPDSQINDDPMDITKDDLGFDKRFSHGSGLSGFTINAPIEGESFTRKQLLDPYYGIRAGALSIRALLKSVHATNPQDPAVVRQVWNGFHGVDPPGRTTETISCFGMADPLKAIIPTDFTICRGDLPLEDGACKAYAEANLKGIVSPATACAHTCWDSRLPISCPKGVCQVRAQ